MGLAGILFISVCALLPSPAQAQCKRWDVGGKWTLTMDNGHELEVDLQLGNWEQQSANITGTGTMTKGGKKPLAAAISGNITANSFAMLVRVADQRIRFLGTVRSNGTMSGTYTDEGFPQIQTKWSTSHRMKCAEANPEQSSSNDTEDNHKNKQSTQAGISANPRVVPLSNGDEGTTTITWNAGAGRPNAEVWVQVNDHNAKLLFTGPKGTETATVKAGKKYVYMLRDGGQQLDTVTVKAAGQERKHHHHHDDDQN